MTADLLFNAVIWAILIFFGLRLLTIKANERIQQRIETLDQEIADIRRRYREVKIEQHGDTLYLFDADTDQFIAQGRTADDFMDRVEHDITFKIMEGEPEVRERFKSLFTEKVVG